MRDNNLDKQLAIRLAEIRLKFLTSLVNTSAILLTVRERLNSDSERQNALETLKFESHKIRGVSATLGFEKLGDLGAICEEFVEMVPHGQSNGQSLSDVARSLDDMNAEIAHVLADGNPAPVVKDQQAASAEMNSAHRGNILASPHPKIPPQPRRHQRGQFGF